MFFKAKNLYNMCGFKVSAFLKRRRYGRSYNCYVNYAFAYLSCKKLDKLKLIYND